MASVLGLARLHQGDGFYLVAWEGDEPLGHAYLALTDPPELQDVSVRPLYRRGGVASALNIAAEEEVRARGFDRIRVTVGVANEPAKALYRRCGYLDVGVPPKRVQGTVLIRTGPIEVDDTLLTWEKRLARSVRVASQSDELAALLAGIAAAASDREPPGQMRTRVIAVDGPGWAGKTSFAEHLAVTLGGCQIVHTDDFASWDNPFNWWPTLVEKVLGPLARGQAGRFRQSEWTPGMTRNLVEVAAAEVLILEGVTASREAFRPYLTYTIWIEAAADLRLQRGLQRGGEDTRAQWEAWMAGEDRYRERERPDEHADLVVSGEHDLWT